ncbi:restriction endonuclease subunit S [Tenacibaculum finnmarkense]|uniref:restriction endonuclease subunit S n=1 Tax=Tenacibaculum finnmarkense TaxID=2781243 RepID=UPI003BB4EB59
MEIITKNNIKKYSTYKNSGVEWLGEIPEHWEVVKLKYLSEIFNGDSLNESLKKKYESDDLSHLAYISSKDINVNNSVITYNNGLRIPKDNIKLKIAPKNSSLLCIEGGSAGRKIAFTNQEVCFVNKLACFSIKKDNNPQYLFFTLKSNPFQIQFKSSMSGMIGGVAISSINNFIIPIPPLSEQTKIAEFLDDKTKKIDEAIAIKTQQINLLKERKQILIHKAVTRGLDTNVKLKNSGVEWIGEIPVGWEVKKIKHIANIQGGFAFNSGNFIDEGIQIIKIANTYMNKLSLDRQPTFVNKSYLTSHKDWIVSKNDILMSLTGTLGKKDYGFAILIEDNEKYLLNQRVAKITVKDGFEPEYLIHLLRSDSYLNQLYCLPSGTKQANLSNDNVINITMPIPPLKERIKISSYIEKSSEKIARAIGLKSEEIEKLKEYKSSLINSVVTGKVRVC